MSRSALAPFALLAALLACHKPAAEKKVRPSAAAGRFYPGDAFELRAVVQHLLRGARRVVEEKVQLVLVPHAGLEYSGAIAAEAFQQLAPGFDRVVVLAANHESEVDFTGLSPDRATHYQLPGMEVPVAKATQELFKKPLFIEAPAAHALHMIEIELPFLQQINGRPFEIVPLIVGRVDRSQISAAVDELARLAGPSTRFVVSVDLSHGHPYAEATGLDRACLEALESMDMEQVGRCQTDGTQVLLIMTELAARLGQTPRLLRYANSGDTGGERSKVVGYGALVYEDRFQLSKDESQALLALARRSLEARVRQDRALEPEPELVARFPRLAVERGAFVTLHKDGKLRGCIGSLEAHQPLALDVARNASHAAVDDSRFSPVAAEELPAIALTLSVLDAPRPLAAPDRAALPATLARLKPGLILDFRGRRSTFLPEVWDEVPEPVEFLGHLCRKQGSPADCWQGAEASFQTYATQHLGD